MWVLLILAVQLVHAKEKVATLWIESDISATTENSPWKLQWNGHYWNQSSVQENNSLNDMELQKLFQQNYWSTYRFDNTELSVQIPVFYENYANLPFFGNPIVGIRNNLLFKRNRFWVGLDWGLPSIGNSVLVWNTGFLHSFLAFQYSTYTWNFMIQPAIVFNFSDIQGKFLMELSRKLSSKNQIVSEFSWLQISKNQNIQMLELGLQHQLPQSNISVSAGLPVSLQSSVSDVLLAVEIEFFPPEIILNSTDLDQDNVLDSMDLCIGQSEDMDGFEDEDGCPDYDNDGDSVLDFEDQCLNQAEDMDGFEDEDGCPDYDNDHDNILDHLDRCPNAAETINRYLDQDGCPDLGNELDFDGDSILDSEDRCPFLAEDFDNFFDEDGCPEIDNDGDGQLDQNDYQPNDSAN